MADVVYRGVDRAGIARTGRVDRSPSLLVESFFDRGWRSLEVRDGSGEQVGGIARHLDTGRRTWWAEAGEERAKVGA